MGERDDPDPNELLSFELSTEERRVLSSGVYQWGGPAKGTEEMARAMGFAGLDDLYQEGHRLSDLLRASAPMTRHDWCRSLLAVEVVFVSGVMGAGSDWRICTGVSDEETIVALRSLQKRLVREVKPLVGRSLGTRPPRRRGSDDDEE